MRGDLVVIWRPGGSQLELGAVALLGEFAETR